MPLGDSITRGTNDINFPNGSIPGGYRKELSVRLTNGGFAFDFIGSSNENAATGIDPDHEGYNGTKTGDIVAQLPALLATAPDIVLLHIGTNDILNNLPVNTAAANLASLIDGITLNSPNRRLYVATIIPITQAWPPQTQIYSAAYLNGNANAYNVQVRSLVTQYANLGRKVFLVEMNGGIVLNNSDPLLNFYQTGDGIHPGQAGYNQMGTIWFNAITSSGSLFPAPPPGVPAGPSSLTASVISGTRINLKWMDNSNNETAFTVYQKTGGGGSWQQLASTAPNITIASATGLLTGASPYYFAVRASNTNGNSVWSNVAAAVPINIALNKPASASSTFSDSTLASNANNGSLTTFWSASVTDTSATWNVDLGAIYRLSRLEITTRQDSDQPVTRRNFEVRASNDPTFFTYTVLTSYGEPSLAYTSTLSRDINPITPFRFVRIAKTDSAYFSFTEARVFGTTPPPVPAPPSNLIVTHTNWHQVALGWLDNSSDEFGFKLERRNVSGGPFIEITTATAGTIRFVDTGLTADSGYVYRVRATNGVDDSAATGEVSATTGPLTSYETWAEGYPAFLALHPTDQLPSADPNNDGVNNLLAFAFGLDPLALWSAGSLPVVLTSPGPAFRFRRNTTSGLIYELLVSSDLSNAGWQIQSETGATIEPVAGEPSVEWVTVPLESGPGPKFARLRVTRN